MFYKKIFVVLLISCLSQSMFAQKETEVSSPDGQLKVTIQLGDRITYSIQSGTETLLSGCSLQMELGDETLGADPKLISQKRSSISNTIHPVVPIKFSTVVNEYNQLLLSFKGNYAIEFRAFNDGIAYRFITNKKGNMDVMHEEFSISFPGSYKAHLQQPGGFKTAYEEPYTHVETTEWNPTDKMSTLPVLIDTQKGHKILISESDLSDYPCMFLQGTGTNSMQSVFPKEPLEFGEDGDRSLKILKEASYIARTTGKRDFPWRYFVITQNDGQLIENTMTLKLSRENQLKDYSWIKPGQASWEWWNDASPYGPDVEFESGYNLDTYKYYIDFASKYGIEYIIMDEGWALSTRDPYIPNPKVDVHEIIRYGKEKT